MLQVAALASGLLALWLLFTQRWHGPLDLGVALGVAVLCVVWAMRFGGASRSGFATAPRMAALSFARAGDVVRGALSTIRAAIAADVTLKPALVRVKTRAASDDARAALAGMISAAPGAIVVEADDDGLLAHVIDEDAIGPAHLGALEARVLLALGEGRTT